MLYTTGIGLRYRIEIIQRYGDADNQNLPRYSRYSSPASMTISQNTRVGNVYHRDPPGNVMEIQRIVARGWRTCWMELGGHVADWRNAAVSAAGSRL